ncbi:aspartate/glutamate racemase family protein [Glycomyces buryatensis]|uniref:Aspartate/glutamate racemase family protein n=1 Tax=Glycomyces buryatensis TaxID=2570927 RepID=A0A4S8Q2U5_9ACTN|nr:aspartate/glutamate racemase family protein [Glycomyces buryatensis]THV38483.1 aspartate/glutamate racemase family protein [Glycomyces buryatensis]
MRTIGLIGGMSWQSSAEYYRLINELTHARLGGQHNAESIMLTVDFAEIEAMQRQGDWEASGKRLATAAVALERAGADLVALCTNTMHLNADAIEAAIDSPFVHLLDTVAASVRAAGLTTVGLLGTRFTMEMGFFSDRMAEHGITVRTPPAEARAEVHDIIFTELTLGIVREESREAYRRIMNGLAADGSEGIIFGCTEIPLLVDATDSPVPVFDTTRIHAERLVELALEA